MSKISKYCKQDILEALDEPGKKKYFFFPNYANMYYDYAGSRMSLYANDTLWAIIFEEIIYNTGEFRFEIVVDYFGNCLKNMDITRYGAKEYISNDKRIGLNSENDVRKICPTNYPFVSKNSKTITIRNEKIVIEHDLKKYAEMGIVPYKAEKKDDSIDITSLLKYLVETIPEKIFAKEEEKKAFLSADLPKIMTLNEWYHQEYGYEDEGNYNGVPPSTYETFQMLADVLVTKDTTKYKPTLKPNTHWSNWTND